MESLLRGSCGPPSPLAIPGSVGTEHPRWGWYDSVAMTRWTLTALRERRNEILEIGRQHGVRMIRVFGSVSRGDATPASDIDLLVDLDQGRSLLDLGGFVADVQDLLGCRVDVVSARGLRPRFRDRVLQDAVAL